MGTDQSNKFLQEVIGEVADKSISQTVESEANKLKDRIPILQAINRREALLGSSDPYGESDEVYNLERALKDLIPGYESKHKERFMYQGVPYLDTILNQP